MSLWNKVKGAAKSAKCMTGWHAGSFKPVEGGPQCQLEKHCPDCNKHVKKTKHQFGVWKYVRERSCEQESFCVHCGEKKTGVEHQHQVVRKEQGTCRQILECARCGDEKMGAVNHNYKLVGMDRSTCEPIKKCYDCGDETRERAQHEWIKLGSYELRTSSENGRQRKCKNCGTLG